MTNDANIFCLYIYDKGSLEDDYTALHQEGTAATRHIARGNTYTRRRVKHITGAIFPCTLRSSHTSVTHTLT